MPDMPAIIDQRQHPLADGSALAWASAWGEDAVGPFVDIAFGEVTQRLRWIPPGAFLMGSPADEEGRDSDEGPQHRVTLTRGFWMFDTPCTRDLWLAVMGNDPSRKGSDLACPVDSVSWDDCQTFLARIEALSPGLALALPTEAQWEYACRAGTTTARYGNIGEIAWYDGDDATDGSHPVATKTANAWGLHDTLGNVREWCHDRFADYSAGEAVNPRVEHSDADGTAGRVVRGGSWVDYARSVRAAFRNRSAPGCRYDDVGFRAVRVPD
jgi:formylglycine-generating enzyme required for sulfatase activity